MAAIRTMVTAVALALACPADGAGLPAGRYTLDPTHSTLVFKVSHLGFSLYVASFARFDATLEFDPARPQAAVLQASVDLASLTLPAPPDGFLATLLGPDWLNAVAHPRMTFVSRSVESTGPDSARVTGDLSLNGRSGSVTLSVTFNGGYPGMPGFDPNARIGFSARGGLNRSDFGVTAAIPPEGSQMGVGDLVTVEIEAEFSGPPLQPTD